MKIAVKNNQCLFDIAIQTLGSAEAIFAIAEANNISISDNLTTGQKLQIPRENVHAQRKIAEYYAVNNIYPATAIDDNKTIVPEGIEYWAIEYDFTVN